MDNFKTIGEIAKSVLIKLVDKNLEDKEVEPFNPNRAVQYLGAHYRVEQQNNNETFDF